MALPMKTPMMDVNSSGADPPAAINVAPERRKLNFFKVTMHSSGLSNEISFAF